MLRESDLMYARPATEFSAQDMKAVIGLRLRQALGQGRMLRRNMVEDIA